MSVRKGIGKTGLLLIPIGLCILLILPYVSYTPDDTYIHLQFARNLLRGGGFSFNSGEPTYGSTSPLWVLLIVSGGLFSKNLLLISKILSICFTLGSVFLFAFMVKSLLHENMYIFACTVIWSVDSWLHRWAPSGMETSFALFVLLLGFLLYGKERSLTKKIYVSPMIFAVLTLIRPEGMLLFLLCCLDQAILLRQRLRSLVAYTLTYSILLAPWLLYASVQFGTVLPNTFIAKGTFPYVTLNNWDHSGLSLIKFVLSNQLWEVCLIFVGLFVLLQRYTFKGSWSEYLSKWPFLFASWILLLPTVYLLKGFPIVTRYLLLITPVIILLGFYALKKTFETLHVQESLGKGILCVLVVLIFAQNMFLRWKIVDPHVRLFSMGMRECFVPIGEWFAEQASPQTTIAALDIGALGYVSDRRVLDLGGLITPAVLPLLRRYDPEELADIYPSLALSIPKAEYIVYRSKRPVGEILLNEKYEPLFTKQVASLGITADPGETYYTVCRIRWDILDRAFE